MKANVMNAIASLIGGMREGMETTRTRRSDEEERLMKRQYMQSLIDKSRGGGVPERPDYLGPSELEYGGFAPEAQIRSSMAPALMSRMSATGRMQVSKKNKEDMLKQFNTVNKTLGRFAVEKAKLEASYSKQFIDEDKYSEKLTEVNAELDYNRKLRDQIRLKLSEYGIEPPETQMVEDVGEVMQEEVTPTSTLGDAWTTGMGEYLGGLKQQFSAPIDYFKNLLNRDSRGTGGGY